MKVNNSFACGICELSTGIPCTRWMPSDFSRIWKRWKMHRQQAQIKGF